MAWQLLSSEALCFDMALQAQRSLSQQICQALLSKSTRAYDYNYGMTTRVQRLLVLNMALRAQRFSYYNMTRRVQRF